MKFKHLITEWEAHDRQAVNTLANRLYHQRWMKIHYKKYHLKKPVDAERYKFNPIDSPFKRKNIPLIALSFFAGCTFFIFLQVQYENEQQIRKPGCVIPQEQNAVICLIRQTKVRANNWINTSFLLNSHNYNPQKEAQIQNIEIPKYREQMMKLNQFGFYKKNKINKFNYLYFGENEEIPVF